VAVPSDPSPLVIDMANSVVAAGKIQAAAAGPDGRLPGQASLDRLQHAQAEGVRVREGTLTAIERAPAELGLPRRLRAESMRP
jgi:LDH2 family malate/lactate/ureidoglycolate dehydrogenase